MKKYIYTICILAILAMGCSSKKLDPSEVKSLLLQAKAYPTVVELRVFCNDTETAKLVHQKGLIEQGLLTAQLAHTQQDVGKPLIYFTSKADPYLIKTSDTLKSIDVQKVKVAVEDFLEVTDIQYTPGNTRALVTYTTRMTNMTPFAAILDKPIENTSTRQTSFTLTAHGWEWDKKIRKL
ncbi:MAG TPA: hypothetical protein VIN08_05270 [Ohtaekwangia sp.]|uniref:hypothetical protein n=1 Tax=Ohtaekwangia sp. TaxID=2066019 RepID=UPI002F94388E